MIVLGSWTLLQFDAHGAHHQESLVASCQTAKTASGIPWAEPSPVNETLFNSIDNERFRMSLRRRDPVVVCDCTMPGSSSTTWPPHRANRPPFSYQDSKPPLYLVSVKRSQTFACSSTAYYCLLGNWPFNHSPRQWITTGSKLAAAPPPAPHEAQRVSWGRVSPLSHLENRHIHRPLAGTLALSCR